MDDRLRFPGALDLDALIAGNCGLRPLCLG
jgi:hypothetical protein